MLSKNVKNFGKKLHLKECPQKLFADVLRKSPSGRSSLPRAAIIIRKLDAQSVLQGISCAVPDCEWAETKPRTAAHRTDPRESKLRVSGFKMVFGSSSLEEPLNSSLFHSVICVGFSQGACVQCRAQVQTSILNAKRER